MNKDNVIALATLAQIEEQIFNECEEYLYCAPQNTKIIFQKVRNAAQSLLNNAARRCRGQEPLAFAPTLSLDTTLLLLKEILQEIKSSNPPAETENKIFKALKRHNINPEEIMQQNPTNDEQYFEAVSRLNGEL